MKKAQIQGQVFIYILTLIITGMILLYGYNAITGISKRAEQVELVKFKNDLKEDFETISFDYGSVKTMSYHVPSNVNSICFCQSGEYPYFHSISQDINPLVRDVVVSNMKDNVFIIVDDVPESMIIGKIKVEGSNNKVVCINTETGVLKLRLEGLGDGVSVEQA